MMFDSLVTPTQYKQGPAGVSLVNTGSDDNEVCWLLTQAQPCPYSVSVSFRLPTEVSTYLARPYSTTNACRDFLNVRPIHDHKKRRTCILYTV